MMRDCYWFENHTWWRVTTKAPCLPDVIHNRKSEQYIDKIPLDILNADIYHLRLYCDDTIGDVTDGAVLLEREIFFKMPT